MSTKTGLAPQWEIVLAVAMKVKGDELRALQHLGDGSVNLVFDGFVLRFQIENGDH